MVVILFTAWAAAGPKPALSALQDRMFECCMTKIRDTVLSQTPPPHRAHVPSAQPLFKSFAFNYNIAVKLKCVFWPKTTIINLVVPGQ